MNDAPVKIYGERTYTTEEAARRLGVPANVISKWKQRGRIHPASHSTRGPVYFLDELVPLANEWARRVSARTADEAQP